MGTWRSISDELLRTGPILVRFDARKPGVVVPRHLAGSRDLGLNLWLPRGARDTFLDETGISETLSFDGARSKVFVPWSTVTFVAPIDPVTCDVDWERAAFSEDDPVTAEAPHAVEPAKPRAGLRLVRDGDSS